MTDGLDTKTTPKPKGWRKKLQFGVSRWDVRLSVVSGIFFIFVFVRAINDGLDWITWIDALQM